MQDTPSIVDAPGPAEPINITFENRGDRLIGLGFVNAFLKIITLGLYSFWGKTEVRRRLWSFTRLNGEPLEYTGTGKELFLGFLIVFFAILLPVFLSGFAVTALFGKNAVVIFQLCVYVLFFFLLGNAMYRAQRYRLSRTRWRGIRGVLTGSPQRYGWTYFWTIAAPFLAAALIAGVAARLTKPAVGGVLVILGLIAGLWVLPWRANKLQGMMTNDMRFGDGALTYTGTSGPLYKRYLFAWGGSALVLIMAATATILVLIRSGIAKSLTDLGHFPDNSKLPPGDPMTRAVALATITIAAIWILTMILAGVITAWYRANQMNHFARNTAFQNARFRLQATGPSLVWLSISNWLLGFLGLLAGASLGFALAAFTGVLHPLPSGPSQPNAAIVLSVLPSVTFALPIILTTGITATFAQFRSTRYFMSRLKLDGPIDLQRVLQGQDQGLRRGEGLAQVFDLDAF